MARPIKCPVEVSSKLAGHFNLTEAEQNEILPERSSSGAGITAPIGRATTCSVPGLLDRPKRGLYVINEAGKQLAAQKPKFIDRDFLMKFPQFVKFAQSTGTKQIEKGEEHAVEPEGDSTTKSKTPEELIGAAYQTIHATLKQELLNFAKNGSPPV